MAHPNRRNSRPLSPQKVVNRRRAQADTVRAIAAARAEAALRRAHSDAERRLGNTTIIETARGLYILTHELSQTVLVRLKLIQGEEIGAMKVRVIRQFINAPDYRVAANVQTESGRLLVKLAGTNQTSDFGRIRHHWRPATPQPKPILDPSWRRAREAAVRNAPPVANELTWEVLPRGWWKALGAGPRQPSVRPKTATYTIERVEFIDSFSPKAWYKGLHLGSVVYHVAIFDHVAVADALEEGNALYYVDLRNGMDWRPVLRLSKQEARRDGAQRIIHRENWKDDVRQLLRPRARSGASSARGSWR